MSAMKTLATALADSSALTWQERDLIMKATLANCKEKAAGGNAYAYLVGMLTISLTDEQIRWAFACSQESQA